MADMPIPKKIKPCSGTVLDSPTVLLVCCSRLTGRRQLKVTFTLYSPAGTDVLLWTCTCVIPPSMPPFLSARKLRPLQIGSVRELHSHTDRLGTPECPADHLFYKAATTDGGQGPGREPPIQTCDKTQRTHPGTLVVVEDTVSVI
ncbi:hypothetical protein Bbelb_101700 [Branchiostoma belcheri]|nr:hypothetical protein Bbelb_101700 [Branchiostoma belcheri]